VDEIFGQTGERTFREKIEDRENDEHREPIVTHGGGRLIKEFVEPRSSGPWIGNAEVRRN